MEPRLTYYGKVTDKIHVYRRKQMQELVVRNFAGMDIQITVERKRKKRSLMQNAYYWGVVVPIVQQGLIDAGYKVGKEQTHDFLKTTFHKCELVNENTGEVLPTVGSTSGMSTVVMMEYFADIGRWAAEFLNVEIPEPGEQMEIELN